MLPRNDSERIYRRYYVDHPTSINHHEPYLIPLENQYSVLNRSRNPYYMLDHLNFQTEKKSFGPLERSNQSLDREMRQWTRRQEYKDSEYRSIHHELKDLSNILKRKESQYERQKMANQYRNLMPNQSMMPISMMMPMPGMGGCSMWNGGCQCRCSCSCQRSCQHSCKHSCFHKQRQTFRQQRPYRMLKTEQPAVEQTSPPPKTPPPQKIPTKISIEPVKSEPKIEVKKLRPLKKKNLLRRFRICAYAVYFCIYFRAFSSQFTLNRYNRFKLKYLVDSGKLLTSAYKEIYYKFLQIDIPGLIRTAADNIPDKSTGRQLDISTLLKTQSVKKFQKLSTPYSLISDDMDVMFSRCAEFISLLLEEVQRIFGEWEWEEHGESLGIGALHQTFMLDDHFLPHELYLTNIHERRGYAKIRPNHERMQVMIKMIIKMVLFNVCLQLDNNKEWLQQKQEELKKTKDTDEVFIFLQISSKIIFVICQFLYEKELEGQQTNYQEVSDRFRVQPCNPLVYSYSIRKRRQLFKKEQIKQSNLLIFGIEKLDQINQIVAEPFFRSGKSRVTNSIISVINQIHAKLKEANHKLYRQIWEQTLSSEYIVLRGLKKILKPNRYQPFYSQSVIPTKKTLKKKDFDDLSSMRSGLSNTDKTKTNKTTVEPSNRGQNRYDSTQVSIKKRIARR